MKFFFAFLLLMLPTGCSAPNLDAQHPVVILDFEPGEVVVQESGAISLSLNNQGTQPVEVTAINTTCGCTLPAGFKGLVLEPGESTSIDLEVTLPSYGTKKVHVSAVTNSPGKFSALATLELQGPEPKTPRVLEKPQSLVISGTQPGEPAEGDFSLTTVEKIGENWIQKVDCAIESVKAEIISVKELDKPTPSTIRRAYSIRVFAPTPSRPGEFTQTILVLNTLHDEVEIQYETNLLVNLKVEYSPRIRAIPEKIIIPEVSTKPQNMTLLFNDPDDWIVTVIENLEAVEVIPRIQNSRLQTFDIMIDHTGRLNSANSPTITFLCTNTNEQIEVNVPVEFAK